MFERLHPKTDGLLKFSFNDTEFTAEPGDTVAAALLAQGLYTFRQSPVSGAPRGPFCMMGACFDCLVEIDGETVQACMVPVREGLNVRAPQLAHRFRGSET